MPRSDVGAASDCGNNLDDSYPINRIILNFKREIRDPARDCARIDKVKKLFQFLDESGDLQEMKACGWFDEGEKEDAEDLEEELEDMEEDAEGSEERSGRGGQRFSMSRDFWYRKLNILKARKLDEVALRAADIPPWSRDEKFLDAKPRYVSLQASENCESVYQEIDEFEKRIAKPAEAEMRKKFVNVYDNKVHFYRHDTGSPKK